MVERVCARMVLLQRNQPTTDQQLHNCIKHGTLAATLEQILKLLHPINSSLPFCPGNSGNDSSQCSATESLWALAPAQDLQCLRGLNATRSEIRFNYNQLTSYCQTRPDTITVGDHLRAGLWQWTWRDRGSGLGQSKLTRVSFRTRQCCENWDSVMPQAHLPT